MDQSVSTSESTSICSSRMKKKKQKYVYEIRTKLERLTLIRGQKRNRKVLFHPEFRLWAHSHHEQNQCILMGSLGLVDLRALFGRGKMRCAALSSRKSAKSVPLSESQTILTVLTFERVQTGGSYHICCIVP